MARKNSNMAAKALKAAQQRSEWAHAEKLREQAFFDPVALLKQAGINAQVEATIQEWMAHNKVTVCKAGKFHTNFPQRGSAMLGDATAGRAYLTTGYRHVYSK